MIHMWMGNPPPGRKARPFCRGRGTASFTADWRLVECKRCLKLRKPESMDSHYHPKWYRPIKNEFDRFTVTTSPASMASYDEAIEAARGAGRRADAVHCRGGVRCPQTTKRSTTTSRYGR